jgi:hypothetical protein
MDTSIFYTKAQHGFLMLLSCLLWSLCPDEAAAQDRFGTAHNFAEAGVYKEFDYRHSYLTSLEAGREYDVHWNFRLGGAVHMYSFGNRDYSTLGLGLRPAIKFFFLRHERFSMFAEVKGGVIYMLPQYPNLAINYTFTGGLGAELPLGRVHRIRFGAGYNHFSNGRRWAEGHNPMWDGLGGYIGWVF